MGDHKDLELGLGRGTMLGVAAQGGVIAAVAVAEEAVVCVGAVAVTPWAWMQVGQWGSISSKGNPSPKNN